MPAYNVISGRRADGTPVDLRTTDDGVLMSGGFAIPAYDHMALTYYGATNNIQTQVLTLARKQELAKQARAANLPVASVGSGQIRAAMILSGWADDDDSLSALIEGLLQPLPDRAVAVTLWRNASEFNRSHPFIEAVRVALNKTNEEVDALFRLAKTL